MNLELSQLHELMARTEKKILVGHLPEAARLHMHCQHDMIHLSGMTLEHIFERHPDVDFFEMQILPHALRFGVWIADRGTSCCVSYRHRETGRFYKVSLKSAMHGTEVYVTTFHKTNPRQTQSLHNRGPILRRHL
jgi:hypothetical protein